MNEVDFSFAPPYCTLHVHRTLKKDLNVFEYRIFSPFQLKIAQLLLTWFS